MRTRRLDRVATSPRSTATRGSPTSTRRRSTRRSRAVDAVWRLARHSALNASQEQFVDTPTREKGAFQDPFDSPVVMAAFGDRAMTFQALRDVARSQVRYWPDGRVNNVYPNGDGKRDIPDATEQYVGWVWQTYLTTGDRTQLAALYPVVRNIADYVARAIDPTTGLVTRLPGGGEDYLYGLVDWPPQMRYGYDVGTAARTTENILAVDVFRRVGQMAARARPAGARGRRCRRQRAHALAGGDRHAAAPSRRRLRRRARARRHARAGTPRNSRTRTPWPTAWCPTGCRRSRVTSWR